MYCTHLHPHVRLRAHLINLEQSRARRSHLKCLFVFLHTCAEALSRSPLIGSFPRSLSVSWEDPPPEATSSPNSLRLSRLFSKADEELDSLTFIQKLVRSCGMDRASCVLAGPLDPDLLEKVSEHEDDGTRFGRRRLLFDAVNEALAELAWTAELAAYPWGGGRSRMDCNCKNGSGGDSAAEEIWRVIRNWSTLDKYPPCESFLEP